MVPIYLKTVYSFLSSTIKIDDIISLACKKHFNYLCICDDNMYGVMEFITKCESNNIKPVVGLDINMCLLYAKNYQGYVNLLHLENIKSEREIGFEDLKNNSSDLVCFINKDSEVKDKLQEIFVDNYVYSDKKEEGFLYLPKVLCLNKDDQLSLKYLNMLRDNKTVSDEYEFNENVIYQDNSDDYSDFFNKIDLHLPKYSLNLPDYCSYNDTKGLNSDDYLENLSILGLNKRMNGKVTVKYKDRLLYELSVIKKMGFSNYFLIVYDFIKYAKNNSILVGPGRGSAAGSLVSFSLGITDVDPIKYDLLFERFLNPERVTMPDIDTDFPDMERDKIIDYVEEKYGKIHVSQITTFGTFGSKMAIRDMGRVMNVPLYIVDDLTKKVGNSISDSLNNEYIKDLMKSDKKIRELLYIAKKIEGMPRHTSIHAAGVIISGTPLNDLVPLIYDNDKYLCGYEAGYLEKLGLLKMDFLSLKNLTMIDNTLKLIMKYQNKNLRFSDIPLSDDKTNKLFQNGDTIGIFQFESPGMREFLIRLHPDCFSDIYNANALYRPGPSMNITSFINRRNGKEKIDYYDDSLKDILSSTNGLMVYQEQIMLIANKMASFTMGEADILRRAMSKKKLSDIEKSKEKFIEGSIKNGYSSEVSHKIFELILNFASYGFNKSHSVAYSMISYKMAYLKAHYPLYFYVSLIDSVNFDEEKVKLYLKEMKRCGIKIIKPDINKSSSSFSIYYDKVILPFNIIKGISSVISKKIIEARGDCFTDIYDFFNKMINNGIPKNIILSLIDAGCLDSLNINRNTLYENMDSLINYANLVKDLGSDYVLKPEIVYKEEFNRDILINNEKNSFGFYLSNHPVTYYKEKDKNIINLSDIKKYFNKRVNCIVMIDKIREIKTKKGELMAFLSCSDEEESIEVILFPDVYKDIKNIEKNDIIKIEGKVERRSDYQIIASSIINVKELYEKN